MVRNAQGDHLFELTLTVGAFRGGLQLEIGEDRLVAPGFFTEADPFVPWGAEGIVGESPVRRRTECPDESCICLCVARG